MPGICPRCNTTVYFNEEKIAIGMHWHIKCFSCANSDCHRRLDSSNLTEHEGDIYCRSCYGKLFGPKGYGYGGGGAGVLSMDTGNKYKNGPPTCNIPATAQAHVAPQNGTVKPVTQKQPRWGGTDICPRCGKAVYMAEKKMGGGAAWHISCFNCSECHKRLESTILCEREGDIYCKTCYGKNFGPKGYGYGVGSGTLQMS